MNLHNTFKKTVLLCLTLFALTSTTFSQSNYVVNGNATSLGEDCFQLTTNDYYQNGSVWFQNFMTLNADFDMTFNVYLGNDDNGADGIAFVMQPNSTGAGAAGGGIGYEGITPSIAVEYDTWQNDDPEQDHISIQPNGNVSSNSASLQLAIMPNLEDGAFHLTRITWNKTTKELIVYWDGVQKLNLTNDLVTNYFGGNPSVYWGWTGATGAATNVQQFCVVSTTFTQTDCTAPAITCPSDTTINTTEGLCGAIVNYSPVLVSGTTPDISYSILSGSLFNNGTTPVTVTATNSCGTVTCTFNVTVVSPNLTASISAKTYIGGANVSCKGSTDGQATVTANGGCLPYSYSWSTSPVQTAATATGLSAGTYTITITDGNGTSVQTTVTITEPSQLVANAGNSQTVYYGYAPTACANLTGSATGGVLAYNYLWSNGVANAATTVCPTTSTIYSLTVTDANGCIATSTVSVYSVNVKCEQGGNSMTMGQGSKVMVCHKAGNGKTNTLCIGASAVADHLAHGDQLGVCGANNPASAKSAIEEVENTEAVINSVNSISIYPNPSNGSFNLTVNSDLLGTVYASVVSITGTELVSLSKENQTGSLQIPFDLTGYSNGIYFLKVQTGGELTIKKIVINK